MSGLGTRTLAPPVFGIGDTVVVTAGLAHGIQGIVLERWPRDIGRTPQYVIGTRDLVQRRVVRADYLRAVVS